MTHILFVDDEPNILDGLRRVLRREERNLRMYLATSGVQALELLKLYPIDVLVTDMRMPGMNGAELLSGVMRENPGVVRFVLSGQSEEQFLLESIGITHRFFSKPCDVDELVRAIEKVSAIKGMLAAKEHFNAVVSLSLLGSLEDSKAAIKSALDEEKGSQEAVVQAVGEDPSVAAKILQLANSFYFGLSRGTASISGSVEHLGCDRLRAFVTRGGILGSLGEEEHTLSAASAHVQHMINVSRWAGEIAEDLGFDALGRDTAQTAGLLHDVGKLIELRMMPESYLEIAATCLESQEYHLWWQAERRVLGLDHAVLGGCLLELWGLPDEVVHIVRRHHDPVISRESEIDLLTPVFFANLLDHEWRGDLKQPLANSECIAYFNQLGIKPARLDIWRKRCAMV